MGLAIELTTGREINELDKRLLGVVVLTIDNDTAGMLVELLVDSVVL